MDIFAQIAEDRIKKAYEEGEFKELPGMGKPLPHDDLSDIPEELRMAYRLLRNAGMVDQENDLKKELLTIQDLLKCCEDEAERKKLQQKLSEKQLALERIRRKGIYSTHLHLNFIKIKFIKSLFDVFEKEWCLYFRHSFKFAVFSRLLYGRHNIKQD